MRAKSGTPLVLILAATIAACSALPSPISESLGIRPRTSIKPGRKLILDASWYGAELKGNRTASGEPFDPDALTAAHPAMPFGTRLRVRNPRNDRSVIVTVNDRGPFAAGRDLDLSKAAAHRLGIVSAGVARVEVEILTDLSARAGGERGAPGR